MGVGVRVGVGVGASVGADVLGSPSGAGGVVEDVGVVGADVASSSPS